MDKTYTLNTMQSKKADCATQENSIRKNKVTLSILSDAFQVGLLFLLTYRANK
jgi:hypothetical protein